LLSGRRFSLNTAYRCGGGYSGRRSRRSSGCEVYGCDLARSWSRRGTRSPGPFWTSTDSSGHEFLGVGQCRPGTLANVKPVWPHLWPHQLVRIFRILPLTWSPLTESNRRSSPYHLKFPRFTARRALPAGRRQALIWFLPRPAVSATARAIAPVAEQQPVRAQPQAQRQLRPRRACPFRPGPWGCLPTSHAHSDGQKTVRRSFPSRLPRARRSR